MLGKHALFERNQCINWAKWAAPFESLVCYAFWETSMAYVHPRGYFNIQNYWRSPMKKTDSDKWVHAYIPYVYTWTRGPSSWQKVANLNWGNITHLASGALFKDIPLHGYIMPVEHIFVTFFGQFVHHICEIFSSETNSTHSFAVLLACGVITRAHDYE